MQCTFCFTGEQYDYKARKQSGVVGLSGGPGLYYLRARFYDPSLGRFLTPDPLRGLPTDPQSLNRYPYARNNPVNRTDPTGLSTESSLIEFRGCSAALFGSITSAYLLRQALASLGPTILAGTLAPSPAFWIYSGFLIASLYLTLEYGLESCEAIQQG